MPTKFNPGARVVHKTLGPGTVTEADGDSVRVELDADNGARERTFMASLGTLELADQPKERPTTNQIARPVALDPKPEPETPTMPDALLTAMNAALAERGKGAIAALTATLGISKNTPNNWRHLGRIPDCQRAAVQNWIDKCQVLAIRVEKTKPAPKAKPAPKLRLVEMNKRMSRACSKHDDASIPPPIRSAIDHDTVLQALGLAITTAWLPDGETMRQVRVAVLP